MYQDPNIIITSGFVNSQATTMNYVNKNQFKIIIPYCPILSQTAIKCSVPFTSIGKAKQKTSIFDLPLIGDKLDTGDFSVTFPILSDLSNYLEVFMWMNMIVSDELVAQNPSKIARLQALGNASIAASNNKGLDVSGLYCDGTLIMCDMNNKPTTSINYIGMVPTDLSSIEFDSTSDNTNPVMATVKFSYIYHTITAIK